MHVLVHAHAEIDKPYLAAPVRCCWHSDRTPYSREASDHVHSHLHMTASHCFTFCLSTKCTRCSWDMADYHGNANANCRLTNSVHWATCSHSFRNNARQSLQQIPNWCIRKRMLHKSVNDVHLTSRTSSHVLHNWNFKINSERTDTHSS